MKCSTHDSWQAPQQQELQPVVHRIWPACDIPVEVLDLSSELLGVADVSAHQVAHVAHRDLPQGLCRQVQQPAQDALGLASGQTRQCLLSSARPHCSTPCSLSRGTSVNRPRKPLILGSSTSTFLPRLCSTVSFCLHEVRSRVEPALVAGTPPSQERQRGFCGLRLCAQ